jgi:hypothetical protein
MKSTTANKPTRTFVFGPALAAATLTLCLFAGCNKPVDDATLTTNVQSALSKDSAISQQPIQVAVQAGVVTLTGNVSDDTASSVAARDAAVVKGVKEVVNSITVAGIAVAPTVTLPAAPKVQRSTTPQERKAIATHQTLPPPPTESAPPQPVERTVTVPAGALLSVRINQNLDSQTTQPGTPFNGVVTHEVVYDGLVVIPAGSAVSGTVVDAKDAAHFKGSSLLSIELTALRRHGNLIQIQTQPYVLEGKGRGGNTAAKVGGGAAIGAVLGGIFGGGKGAAIGAAAGGGGGAVVQGVTRGQQVSISSESIVPFRLSNSFSVQTSETPYDAGQTSGLQPR